MSSRRRVRRLLPLVALSGIAALALSACAGGANKDASASGGELVWAMEKGTLSDGHMDPQTSQTDGSAMVQRAVLDSLVWQEKDGSFSPWLAESWTISPDAREYTFTLRKDVKFHDGEAFNAAAVKANFDRIADPKNESAQAASMLGGETYAGTEVIDDHTAKVTFSKPYAPFLQAASTANLGFYAPKALEKGLKALRAGGPDVNIGTGPFKLTEFTRNQDIVYTKNPDYVWGPHGSGPAKLDSIRVNLVGEPSVRTGMLKSGEAQLVTNIPASNVSELPKDAKVVAAAYPGLPYSLYLNEKFGVFGDEKVRQAFSRSIDIDSDVKTIFKGQLQRAWSILGPTTPDYDASLEKTWPFDAAKANELLDEAGWTGRDGEGYRTKDGKRLSATWIAWTPVSDDNAALATAIQADAKKVGFEVKRDVLDPGLYMEKYKPKTFDIVDWGFSGVDADLLRSHLGTDGYQNASQVSNPEVDALIKTGAENTDQQVRAEAYKGLQQWNAKHVAIVPLYVPALISAHSDKVKGLSYDLYGRPIFTNVTLG